MTDHKPKDDKIVREALERFKESQDESSFNRESWKEDVEFARLGEQWDPKIKAVRQDEGRPCLTINKLPAFIRQVVNDSRQNKPGVVVNPVDNGADKETADVLNGIIRSIERNSNAATAYDTAIDHAVSGGFGFFRISIDFVDNNSFEMEARIERIPNPLSVHWDINTTSFDASDWEYAFVSDLLDDDEFKRRYPKADPISFDGYEDQSTLHWTEGGKIRVAEYFLREEIQRKLLLFSDGRVLREDLFDDQLKALMEVNGITVQRERMVIGHKVIRRVMNGVEILEEEDWPGELIPICPVWGEEVIIEGKRHLRSMIHDARDPQVMFNFWRSASTELVALAPRAPYIGPVGFIPRGQEKKWQNANTRSYPYLEYEGQIPPQRQPFAGVPAGAIQEALNASDDMKAITGIFDSSLGARSNETSGRAILARQRESDVSNFHFIDNLSRAIQYAGKVLVEIIPSVYSERTSMRIVGADEKEKVVKLVSGQLQPEGNPGGGKLYDLSVGKYDVSVKAGPSYASQREETREALIEIMRQVPGAGQLIGDIVLDFMDFQNADKVAKRLHRLLPPEIQKAEAEDLSTDLPPEAQQVLGQAQEQIGQLTNQLQQAGQVVQEAQQKVRELEGTKANESAKVQLEAEKIRAQQELEAAKLEFERERLALETSLKRDIEAAKLNDSRLLKPGGSGKTQFEEDMDKLAEAIMMMAQRLTEGNEVNTQLIQQSIAANNMPKRVVRDKRGKVVGVETIQEPIEETNGQ